MALDGIVIANIVHELRGTILGGRLNRIAQPEKDELILTINSQSRQQYKLLLSAGAGLPLIYLTQNTKANPITAPNFCMLLRKHINNAKIIDITQPEMERIINLKLEHIDELGDLSIKYLIIELMGKHSNIIFCSEDMVIIDSIKRVNQFVSSIREVLPGRKYFIPETLVKHNPYDLDFETFIGEIINKPQTIGKALYTGITGISPLIANEICYRASIDSEDSTSSLNDDTALHLFSIFKRLIDDVKNTNFAPHIITKDDKPIDFSSLPLTSFQNYDLIKYQSPSSMLEDFYASKSKINRMKQKSVNLRKVVNNQINRTQKKYNLQCRQLKDTEKREKYKIYGELITAYGYNLEPGAKSLKAYNYYENKEIIIPLDSTITPIDNAKRYFKRYNKMKRTNQALTSLIKKTSSQLAHLKSIQTAINIATDEDDLSEIRQELSEYGYVRKKLANNKKGTKKSSKKSKKNNYLHYISSDGFHMYVGKNNYQNDYLSFKVANADDWWFHAKKIPGSHVIVISQGNDLPGKTIEEAASLAAHYSSARKADKVDVDYTKRKNLKKPRGNPPGFVIYNTYYSVLATTDISGIEQV